MRIKLTLWAWRRWVYPGIIGYFVHDKVTGRITVFTPCEVEMLVRKKRLKPRMEKVNG